MVSHALRRADCVTCDAEHMVAELVALSAREDRVSVINFGVDTDLFRPGSGDDSLRQTIGLADGPVVVSLRSLTALYDVRTLMRVVPLVVEKVPGAMFVVAGDGEERPRLKKLFSSLGVVEHVRFIGQIPNKELPRYLNLSDVYVSTALSDAGLAASTAEAMACGLPAVVTHFGDNGEWVQDGVNGYLFPPGDAEALASRLVDLLCDTGKRRRFGDAGRKVIVERNNYEVQMGKMERIYVELIERYKQ